MQPEILSRIIRFGGLVYARDGFLQPTSMHSRPLFYFTYLRIIFNILAMFVCDGDAILICCFLDRDPGAR